MSSFSRRLRLYHNEHPSEARIFIGRAARPDWALPKAIYEMTLL
jgi:hypothetical protein